MLIGKAKTEIRHQLNEWEKEKVTSSLSNGQDMGNIVHASCNNSRIYPETKNEHSWSLRNPSTFKETVVEAKPDDDNGSPSPSHFPCKENVACNVYWIGCRNIRPCPAINPGCISSNPKSSNFSFPCKIEGYSSSGAAIQQFQDAIIKTQKNAKIQLVEDTPTGNSLLDKILAQPCYRTELDKRQCKYLRILCMHFAVDGGFGRDVVEFLVNGNVVSYRAMATKITYIYPFTTTLGDSKGQEERLQQIINELGWYAPRPAAGNLLHENSKHVEALVADRDLKNEETMKEKIHYFASKGCHAFGNFHQIGAIAHFLNLPDAEAVAFEISGSSVLVSFTGLITERTHAPPMEADLADSKLQTDQNEKYEGVISACRRYTYRAMATKITYIYLFTTALGDSKGQEERLQQIVNELGWYAPRFDLMD
ncbi:hypothetical protein SASPL_136402 [Salvia splendens]|uniref:Uncharacterized protein n=1 Tax=Salvia splendens TaxID=180675 RepID=A0A8X8ZGL2_SALSN|nr:hypothetical protein SASPL_136402 [Salvia splendens]